jgi:hypothetical protein
VAIGFGLPAGVVTNDLTRDGDACETAVILHSV